MIINLNEEKNHLPEGGGRFILEHCEGMAEINIDQKFHTYPPASDVIDGKYIRLRSPCLIFNNMTGTICKTQITLAYCVLTY